MARSPGLQPVRLSRGRRVAAWVLAPVMLLGLVACIVGIVGCLVEGDCAHPWRWLAFPSFVLISGSVVARKILRAAITGYDPASVDRAREDAERRAMLAALRATGEERPELPPPPRG